MKKKLLLPVLALASVFALASCNGKAEIVYTNAEGSEVKAEITKTEDKEEVIKAVNALNEASKTANVKVSSLKVDAKTNVELDASTKKISVKGKAEATAEAQVGYEKVDDQYVIYGYSKGTANVDGSYSLGSDLSDMIGGMLGTATTTGSQEIKFDNSYEGYFATNDEKVYLSLGDLKGFVNAESFELPALPGDMPEFGFEEITEEPEFDSSEFMTLLVDLANQSLNVKLSISNVTKDTVEFTISTDANEAATGANSAFNAMAGAEIKITVSTVYFIPVKVVLNAGAALKAALEESQFTVNKADAYFEANISVNTGVKKLSENDKAQYSTDITESVEAIINGAFSTIMGSIGGPSSPSPVLPF